MVENVGVAVGIKSQAQSVQFLFPFPVSVAAIFIVGSWPTSSKDARVISKSGMVENMGVKVEIAAPSLTVQK